MTDVPSPESPSKAATPAASSVPRLVTFFRRLFSSILLWALIVAAVFIFSPLWQYVVLTTLGAIALREVYQILEKSGLRSFKTSGLVGGIALMTGGWWFFKQGPTSPQAQDFETCVMLVFVLGVFVRMFPQKYNPQGMATMAATLFGLVYVPWLLSFITKIRFVDGIAGAGKYYVLYLVVVTKFSDMGAYLVGSLFGRHKMIPRISPNKTWEGAIGAVIVATLGSLGCYHLLGANGKSLGVGMNMTHAAILGVLLGVVAIIGDLAKSQMKREAGVKDSGNFLPGIGGALDLIDSLLFTAPLLYVYLRLVLKI